MSDEKVRYTEEARDEFFAHLKKIGFVNVLLEAGDGGLIFNFTDIVDNYLDYKTTGFNYNYYESLNLFDIEMLAELIRIDNMDYTDIDIKSRLMEIYTILDEKYKLDGMNSHNLKSSKNGKI